MQMAELLGIPESEVSRMDGRLLHPVRTGDRRWLYDLAELRALLDRSSEPRGGRPIVSGETTAEVFELFEAGKTLAQALIATRQTAETIMHLRAEYDRMVGAMVLPAATVSELRTAIGMDFGAHTVVEVVKAALLRMFQEGREYETDLGVVLDPRTGKMKPILRTPPANGSVAAAFSAGPRADDSAAVQPGAPEGDRPPSAPSGEGK